MYKEKIVNITASKAIYGTSAELFKKIVVISLGETNVGKGTSKEINVSQLQSITASGTTKKTLDTYFQYAPDEVITILELGTTSTGEDTLPKQIAKVGTLIDNGDISGYYFVCPPTFLSDAAFATLVSKYNDVNQMVYFVSPVSMSEDLSTATNVKRLSSMKSCICILEQLLDENQTAVGAFVGTYMSKFIISTSNKLKSFTYVFINQQVKSIDKTKVELLKKYNIVYFGNIIGKPSFINVKCMDGDNVETYIAYDNMSIRLSDAITNVLVNANNLNDSALLFDNNSILMLKSVIENELNSCKDLKLVIEYGSKYSPVTKEILNQNSIGYVDAVTYKTQSYDKYQQSTYDAFSVNIRLAKYILIVGLSINLY